MEERIRTELKKDSIGSLQSEFSQEISNLKKEIEQLFEMILSLKDEEESEFFKFFNLNKTFSFKLTNLLINFIEIENTILNSSSTHYYETILNDESQTIFNENKLSRQTDSFLTQYFSILDIFIKGISSILGDKNVDGIGTLWGREEQLQKKNKDVLGIFFDPLLKESIGELKDYRDYSVHKGNVSIQKTIERPNEEYHLTSYHILKVKRKEGREYSKDKKWMQKINLLIRNNIFNLLYCTKDTLSKIQQSYWDETQEEKPKIV